MLELLAHQLTHIAENASILPATYNGIGWSKYMLQFTINWILLYFGAVFFYFLFSTASFYYFYIYKKNYYYPESIDPKKLYNQIMVEIKISMVSMPFTAILIAPFATGVQRGNAKVYYDVSEYGWGYLLLSIPLFLFMTDMAIYFIHRGLHFGLIYQYIHKPHHTFKWTTPFSSHAFHPIDGWAQGIPYYLFVFIFPLHYIAFILLFLFVNFWTISIHDQVDFCGSGFLNSTGHHTLHHTQFLYNYGQYFTLWDRVCGTYKPAQQTNNLLTGNKITISLKTLPDSFKEKPN